MEKKNDQKKHKMYCAQKILTASLSQHVILPCLLLHPLYRWHITGLEYTLLNIVKKNKERKKRQEIIEKSESIKPEITKCRRFSAITLYRTFFSQYFGCFTPSTFIQAINKHCSIWEREAAWNQRFKEMVSIRSLHLESWETSIQ